jgi:hypothetical protein
MMSKPKIMLFFEDHILTNILRHNNFVEMLRIKLSSDFEISRNYGKVGTKKNLLFFAENDPYKEKSCIFPFKEIRNNNSRDITSKLPKLAEDEIPFFVIDTDGIEILNFSRKILGINFSGKQSSNPNKSISGSGELLPKLLENIYQDRIFSNYPQWGLVLVNSNFESSYIQSIVSNHPDFDDIIFETPYSAPSSEISLSNQKNISIKEMRNLLLMHPTDKKEGCYEFSNLGISYWNKDRKSQRFLGANRSDYRNDIGRAIKKHIKDIWRELLVVNPDILCNAISSDISVHYKIIVDKIVEDPIYSKLENNNKYKNAKNSVFSIYLKKRKKVNPAHPDYPRRLPADKFNILNYGVSSNFDIQYFYFNKSN